MIQAIIQIIIKKNTLNIKKIKSESLFELYRRCQTDSDALLLERNERYNFSRSTLRTRAFKRKANNLATRVVDKLQR